MTQLFANNASTTLNGAINNSVTAITLTDSTEFPTPSGSDYFLATLFDVSSGAWEVVKCTDNTANVLTVTRGHEGSAAAFADDDLIQGNLTQATMDNLPQLDVNNAFAGNVGVGNFLNFGSAVELTIAAGVVTATQTYHTIDTEADAATDDLDTINGGSEGDIVILRTTTTARVVTVKDGTGNILIEGDFVLTNSQDTITLLHNGSFWIENSRANNA